jgi:hypothetical protein
MYVGVQTSPSRLGTSQKGYTDAIVVPALAGPFNLGNVVSRAKIDIDPYTAQVTVDQTASEQIRRVIDGIPLQIEHVNVTINRKNLTFTRRDVRR